MAVAMMAMMTAAAMIAVLAARAAAALGVCVRPMGVRVVGAVVASLVGDAGARGTPRGEGCGHGSCARVRGAVDAREVGNGHREGAVGGLAARRAKGHAQRLARPQAAACVRIKRDGGSANRSRFTDSQPLQERTANDVLLCHLPQLPADAAWASAESLADVDAAPDCAAGLLLASPR